MNKLINNVSLIAIVLILISVNSCTKESKDTLVSNRNNTAMQKWNSDEGYPFVLPDAMQPYQHAVFQEDFEELCNYTCTFLKSYNQEGKKGYFILSNAEGNLI